MSQSVFSMLLEDILGELGEVVAAHVKSYMMYLKIRGEKETYINSHIEEY